MNYQVFLKCGNSLRIKAHDSDEALIKASRRVKSWVNHYVIVNSKLGSCRQSAEISKFIFEKLFQIKSVIEL